MRKCFAFLLIALSLAFAQKAQKTQKVSATPSPPPTEQPAEQPVVQQPEVPEAPQFLDVERILEQGKSKEQYKASILEISDSVSALVKMINSASAVPLEKSEPKGEFEKQAEYEKRAKTHDSLQIVNKKAKIDYLNKRKLTLSRAKDVLADYILQIESSTSTETVEQPHVAIGSYDSEKEEFEVSVTDTSGLAGKKSPFVWNGKVAISLDTAKTLDKKSPNFSVGIEYINYPFEIDSAKAATAKSEAKINLAMKNLSIQRSGAEAKANGTFAEIQEYKKMPNYDEWKSHSDSILSGMLKPQNLNADYALKFDYAKVAAADAAGNAASGGSENGDGGLGWRGISRIVLSVAAVGAGAFGFIQNQKAVDEADKVNKMSIPPKNSAEYPAFVNNVKKANKNVSDYESNRNASYIGAGACLGLLGLTFAF